MEADSRQIAQMQHRLAEMRRLMNRTFDEMADRLDSMVGQEPESNNDWKNDFNQLCQDLKKKK